MCTPPPPALNSPYQHSPIMLDYPKCTASSYRMVWSTMGFFCLNLEHSFTFDNFIIFDALRTLGINMGANLYLFIERNEYKQYKGKLKKTWY